MKVLKATDHGAGEASETACLAALQEAQPFKAWSKEMVEALGNEQDLTMVFHYGPSKLIKTLGTPGRPTPRPRPKVQVVARVALGMSIDQVVAIKGKPTSRTRTVSEEGTTDVLIYPNFEFTFKDGKLKSWTESQ